MEKILPQHKKSQLTVFILITLVLVLIVAFALSVGRKPGIDIGPEDRGESLQLFVESCLKIATLNAVQEHGLDPGISTPLIEEYVTTHMPSCLNDFDIYKEEGLEVTEGEMNVDAVITSEALNVDLDFPITLKSQDTIMQFERTSYQFPRKIMTTLNLNAETVVISTDKKMLLIIQPGTQATLDGESLDRIGIEILDREFNGHSNSILTGMLAFAGIPHGVKFSKEVTLIHFYDEGDVPAEIEENEIKLAFYDSELGVWVALPTTVDYVNNILTTQTTHFSPYGAVVRCTADEDITLYHTPLLVKEDCEPCDGWSSGSPPGGIGDLWIESKGITKGKGLGEVDVCDGPTKKTKKVTSCSNCDGKCTGDVNGSCPEPPGGGIPACNCETTYYSYEQTAFEGSTTVNIDFAEDGDSCIWTEKDRSPTVGKSDSSGSTANYDDADIKIATICPEENGDTCHITQWLFVDSRLSFQVQATNAESPVDACLKAGVTLTFSGFGIQNEGSSYTCTSGEGEKYMPVIGGEFGDMVLSVCTCDGDRCIWVPKEDEDGIPPPGGGNGDGFGDDAGARRKRDKCPEGDKEKQEYESCPEDFEEKYLGKSFTYKEGIAEDTRTRKFCDMFGDYPEMQYVDWSLPQDTELYVMYSALRDGRCWIMVEAQEWIEVREEKPDFYLEFKDAANWIPVNGTDEEENDTYEEPEACTSPELGYEVTNLTCESLGEYACGETEGEIVSLVCCGTNGTGDIFSKTCAETCEEETGMCAVINDTYEEPEACTSPELGYEDTNLSCDVLGEYACGETEGEIVSKVCCGTNETGDLFSKTCAETCEEETGMCAAINDTYEDPEACTSPELGYEDTHVSCDFPGEYRCEDGGEGIMLSQVCCKDNETSALFSKVCVETCEEETRMCTEDITP